MKRQRLVGVALFVIGIVVSIIGNLVAGDEGVRNWYQSNRFWVLVVGVAVSIAGAGLAYYSKNGGTRMGRSSNLSRDERESLQRQLANHKRTLELLREQVSMYPEGQKPVYLLSQIDEEEQKIQRIEERLH